MKNKKSINILLIEENTYLSRLVEKQIAHAFEHYNLTISDSFNHGFTKIINNRFDILILDTDNNPKTACKQLKDIYHVEPNLPIILVADIKSYEIAHSLYKYGVEELLQKDDHFYVAVPQLIKSILSDMDVEKEVYTDSLIAEKNQKTGSEINSAFNNDDFTTQLGIILSVSASVLEDNYKYDNEITQKFKIINDSARQLHDLFRISTTCDKKRSITRPSTDNSKASSLPRIVLKNS